MFCYITGDSEGIGVQESMPREKLLDDYVASFSPLSPNPPLGKEFSSDVESTIAAVRALSATTVSSGQADLTNLFRLAAHEAKKSHSQNRILRVIIDSTPSSIQPHHQWPVNQKLFTLDVMYLHDKAGPDNCPQAVYDALVDVLEHVSEYEGYIHESGHGLPRTFFRFMSMLLCNPQQRCPQDDTDIPKPLMKKSAEPANGEDKVHVSASR